MICPSCEERNPAGARFCVACGVPLPRVCPHCGAHNPANARFCNQCGNPLPEEPAGAGTPPQNAPPRANTPASGFAKVGQVAQSEPTEQRRIVTILFADITGSTALAEGMEPEDVRTLLASFFETMAQAIKRHGGTVEKYIGDAVMAVFGLPVSHEDDPLRAVRAALDMQEALQRLNAAGRTADAPMPQVSMRIGINTGEVAAGAGTQDGRDFLVTGDAVNVAARLQQHARSGSIVVGARTRRGTAGFVRYRELEPIRARGKSRVLPAYVVVGLEDANAADAYAQPHTRTPMVGRATELELLRALGSRVRQEQRPHLITILGAPGIGKTRLAREYIDQEIARSEADSEQRRIANHGAQGELRGVASSDSRHESAHLRARVAGASNAGATGEASSVTPVARDPSRSGTKLRVRPAQPTGKMLALEGRCPPYGEGITYWALAEILRGHCGFSAIDKPEVARERLLACVRAALVSAERADDPETLAAYLGYTIGIESPERRARLLPADGEQLQEGLLRAWRTFFEALAGDNGLIVLVEDLHWAEDALLVLLQDVAARADGVALLLLATSRPDLLERHPDWGGGKANHVTLVIEALRPSDAEEMLNRLMPGTGVPEALRRGILDKAEGNPFFVEETVRMLIDRAVVVRTDGGGWEVSSSFAGSREIFDPVIPDTVQGVLMARLDVLPADERDLLQHAAVIGRYFWASALLYLAPHLTPGRLDATLLALRDRGLIHVSQHASMSLGDAREPVYSFNHALIREIVYSTIVRTRRAHEHARVAEWMEQRAQGREEEFADILAQHYRQYYVQANLARARSEDRRRAVLDKVLHYLMLAGEQALAHHAAAKADRQYTEALALLEVEEPDAKDLPLRVTSLRRRGDARWMMLNADDAWADYREALVLWSAGSVDGQAGYEASHDSATSSASDGTERRVAAAEKLTDDLDLIVAPPGIEFEEWCAWGMRLYRLLVQLPTRFPSFFRQLPPHEELRAYLERGLALADRLGLHESLDEAALLTAKGFFWWSWPERRSERELLDALRSAREAVRIATTLHDPHGASEALDALGNILATTTDLRGFLESQQRRLDWVKRIDDPGELVDIHAELSSALHLVGDYAQAADHAARALALADASEMENLRVTALRSQVLAYIEWDHWGEALETGRALLDAAARADVRHSHHHMWAMLALASVHARRGEREKADDLSRRVAEFYSHGDTQYLELFRARLALAYGSVKEARQILEAALECRSGRQVLAHVLAELAELAARTGDDDLWEQYGAQALELGWRSGARKALAQAVRARGIVALAHARWDDALADLQGALTRYEELGTHWEEARARYSLAGLYQRRNVADDRTRAREQLSTALELFQSVGAVRDVARAKAAISGGSVRLP